MAPTTVLIVDDNRDFAENLGEVLADEGYDCAVAFDATAALEQIAGTDFALVITDLRMRAPGGLAVVAAARRRSRSTAVLLVTAFADDVQLDAARAAGVLDVLAKPIDTERFVQFVRERLPIN